MKCCASQTTSIVRNVVAEPRALAHGARDVAAAFTALLFGETFKPVARAMGFYGDTVVGFVAHAMAQRERGGMTDRLERAIEEAARERAQASANR